MGEHRERAYIEDAVEFINSGSSGGITLRGVERLYCDGKSYTCEQSCESEF